MEIPARTLLRLQVEDFLIEEAWLLDNWRLEEWARLFTEDGKYWDRAIPFLKYGGMYTDPNATNNYCLIALGQPHTFVLEWDTLGLTISYDGKTCLKNQHWLPAGMLTPVPFDQPFMIAMTQILGSGVNKPPSFGAVSTSTMTIDWVKVWK